MSSGGGGGGGQQTVTQTKEIPDWQKDYALQNEAIAASLASRPYQQYQGQMVAGFTPQQQASQAGIVSDAYHTFQPFIQSATNLTNTAAAAGIPHMAGAGHMANVAQNAGTGALQHGMQLTQQGAQGWNANAAGYYMNPYAMEALAPQLQQLELQRAQNRKQIGQSAAQAGAFGDARHGVAESLNDYYSDMNRSNVIAQGMNEAYGTGMNAFMTDQSRALAAGNQMGQMGQQQQQMAIAPAQLYAALGQQMQDMYLKPGQQLATLGQMNQDQSLAANKAVFDMGTQQQQLQQQQMNLAYQNFMNQVNYPIEMLNLRIAALANSPYDTTQTMVQPPSNATAMNVGALGALAGGVGSLLGGGGGGGGSYGGNYFGGS